MSGTVGNYQQGAFTSPTTGQPGDASVVLGNDNNVRSKHNSHDADATIHVQSSVLASRPAAGTAQRVWVTTDGFRAYLDDGANWQELAYLSLAAGGTVAGAVTLSSTLHTVGAVTLDSTLTVATAVSAGSVGSGSGGTFRSVDDGGTLRWTSGILGNAGARDYSIFDNVAAATRLTIDHTSGLVSLANGLTVTGTTTSTAFSGPLTGDVTGNVTGNVTGAVTGNASTATKLATARNINGVAFDGSADITITVMSLDANNLTGTILHATVVTSSLTAVGALASGSIASGFGSINIGTNALTAGAASLVTATLADANSVSRIAGSTITLANNATATLATGLSSTSRLVALVAIGNSVGIISAAGTVGVNGINTGTFSNTSGNAGTVNIFIATGTLTIENKTGISQTMAVTLLGAI